MTDIRIERASDAALPACFALLPEMASPDAEVLAARDGEGRLLGAGALLWRSVRRWPALPAMVTVLPDARRRGVGRALAAALARRADAVEGMGLVAAWALEETGEAAAFARGIGATPSGRHFFFEADARDFVHSIESLVAALSARGRIPADAACVPLAEAPQEAVARLAVREVDMSAAATARMLARAAVEPPETAPADRRRSMVLMREGEVLGALLSRRLPERDVSEVICNVVSPELRGRWANAMLLAGFARRAVEDGCFRIAFDCREEVRDTVNLARRSKADLREVRHWFRAGGEAGSGAPSDAPEDGAAAQAAAR